MRFGESNKWHRKNVEQLGDDDLLDLFDQTLEDGEEQTRHGVALIDEVRNRWQGTLEREAELRELVDMDEEHVAVIKAPYDEYDVDYHLRMMAWEMVVTADIGLDEAYSRIVAVAQHYAGDE